MSTWSDPETGITITQWRARRTSETVQLRACPEIGDLYLGDLRQLVERCAHLPGNALVQPRADGINIEYVVDVDEDEPTADGPEDHATDRERDRAVGL